MTIDNQVLQALLNGGSHTDLLNQMFQETKEKMVLSIHRTKIQKWINKKNGKEYVSYATRPNGEKKYVKRKTYEALIDVLYDIYITGDTLTVSAVWEQVKTSTTNIKTVSLKEYDRLWKKYFAPYPLAKMSIKKLAMGDWEAHYVMICQEHKMTKRQVDDARNVVSHIYKYAIQQKIVDHNPARDVLYSELPVQKTAAYNSVKVTPFTEEQADKVRAWCRERIEKNKRCNPIYMWAIILNLCLGLRFGELAALKWEDIDLDSQCLTVKEQLVREYDDDDFSYVGKREAGNMKGYEAPRVLPIPEDVAEAFRAIRALNLSDVMVFPVLRYHTLNDKVKDAAEAIGLNRTGYRTHSLRATAATVLYMRTKDLYQVQALLGHTNVEMTMKYVKDILKTENLRASMLADSSFSGFVPSGAIKNQHFLAKKNPGNLDFSMFSGVNQTEATTRFELLVAKNDTSETAKIKDL